MELLLNVLSLHNYQCIKEELHKEGIWLGLDLGNDKGIDTYYALSTMNKRHKDSP